MPSKNKTPAKKQESPITVDENIIEESIQFEDDEGSFISF